MEDEIEEMLKTIDMSSGSELDDSDDSDDLEDDLQINVNQSVCINYPKEITNQLNLHKEYTIDNALKLNRLLQKILGKLKNRLENVLHKCENKYMKNEEILSLYKDKKKHKLRKAEEDDENVIIGRNLKTYTSCGSPYFKDRSFFPAPNNSDYLERKNLHKELFLFDLNTVQHCWTLRDKINVVQGVRDQITFYLKLKLHRKRWNNNNNSNRKIANSKNLDEDIEIKTKNLSKLLEESNDFKIDWYRISVENLNSRHPENACITMWNMYLKPDINRDKWTTSENNRLLKLAKKYNYENWEMIASEMNNRSEYQCFVQYRTEIIKKISMNNKWTKQEDQLLINVVEKYRVGKVIRWNLVLMHFPHRTKKQVYARYEGSINPNIKKGKFTEEEDCIIMAAIKQYGDNFSNIPLSLFPGRSRIQVRNRYNNVLKYNKIQKCWTIEDDKKLLNLIKIHGESNWHKISNEFKYHSRFSCRTRYTVIKKYLEKYPNTKLEDLPRKKRRPLTDVDMDNWTDKMIEIREKSLGNNVNKNKKIKKDKYIEKLRPIEKEFYEYFKLSYNFKFGYEYYCKTKNWEDLLLLTTLFGFNIKNDRINEKKNKFNKNEFKTIKFFINKLNRKQNRFCIIRSDFMLPPNWSTLIGLRALYIQLSRYKKKKSNLEEIKNESNENDNGTNKNLINVAKKKFRDRFFSIFYRTGILNKIELIKKTEKSTEETNDEDMIC